VKTGCRYYQHAMATWAWVETQNANLRNSEKLSREGGGCQKARRVKAKAPIMSSMGGSIWIYRDSGLRARLLKSAGNQHN